MDLSGIDTDSKKGTPRVNALQHAQYLIEQNLIEIDDFADILERINDKKNEKEWNEKYVNILGSICEKGQCYRYMHEKSSEYYGALSSKFTYFSMIFSFLLSAFTLSANNIEIIDENLINTISGVGHILIAGITGIHKKMNLPENSEAHRKASKDFDVFSRKIQFQLILTKAILCHLFLLVHQLVNHISCFMQKVNLKQEFMNLMYHQNHTKKLNPLKELIKFTLSH